MPDYVKRVLHKKIKWGVMSKKRGVLFDKWVVVE